MIDLLILLGAGVLFFSGSWLLWTFWWQQ